MPDIAHIEDMIANSEPLESFELDDYTDQEEVSESRRRAPCRFEATGFSPPLPEPDLRLSFRIRLSRRHGEVRLPQPGEAVPADWRQGEQKLLC